MGDIEIFINFLNWALPALAILTFIVGVPIFILWYIFEGKKRHNISWMFIRVGLAFLGIIGMFVVYGLIQLLVALFGI